jgi:elongation factor Tu
VTEELTATVYLLRTEEGGRRTPIASGYRSALAFEPDSDDLLDAVMELSGRDELQPGDSGTVRLRPLNTAYWQGIAQPESPFEVREGKRVIGRGTIQAAAIVPRNGEVVVQAQPIRQGLVPDNRLNARPSAG